MGVSQPWHEHFLSIANAIDPEVQYLHDGDYKLVVFKEKLIVHLIPIVNPFNPYLLIQLQEKFQKEDKMLVQLWEDVWYWKKDQVLSRIKSFLNLNKSVHGRKAKIEILTPKQAKAFFTAYHLQGYVGAKFNYGLVMENEIVAAAGFSAARAMKTLGANYHSTELVRFASKDGFTVVGGLSKLIKHFFKQFEFDDLMTYADRDWSLGKGYEQLKFNLTAVTPPADLYVDSKTGQRYFPHRLPKELISAFEDQKTLTLPSFMKAHGFNLLFNTGNLKYHLYR